MSIINHRLHRWTSSHPVVVSCSMESQKKIPMDFPKVLPITPTCEPCCPASHVRFPRIKPAQNCGFTDSPDFLEIMRLSGPF